MSVLSVKNLIYGYSKGTPFEKGALKGVSVDFEKGEIKIQAKESYPTDFSISADDPFK